MPYLSPGAKLQAKKEFPQKILSRTAAFHSLLCSVQVLGLPGQRAGFFSQHSQPLVLCISPALFCLADGSFRLFDLKVLRKLKCPVEGQLKMKYFIPLPHAPFPYNTTTGFTKSTSLSKCLQAPAQQSWQNTFWNTRFTSSDGFSHLNLGDEGE